MATTIPRTQLHTTDLDGGDFAIREGKVISKGGFAGPFEITEGTIGDYSNRSAKPELVWLGGTEADPTCVWVVFPNNTAVKIKWPAPNELGFCATVKECLVADLARGGGTREKYVISSLGGPTWQVLSVTYGPDETEVDFSGDSAASLILLMGTLNSSENLPDGWLWTVSGGYLVLSTPHETGVSLVSLPGGLEQTFTVPSVAGSPASSLTVPLAEALAAPLDGVIQQYEELLASYTALLGDSVEWSSATTEAAVVTAYSAYAKATVRWTDADGDPRVSYKTPGDIWYHPVDKMLVNPFVVKNVLGAGTSTTNVDISSAVPSDARIIKVQISLNAASADCDLKAYIQSGTARIEDHLVGSFLGPRRFTSDLRKSPSSNIVNAYHAASVGSPGDPMWIEILIVGWSR